MPFASLGDEIKMAETLSQTMYGFSLKHCQKYDNSGYYPRFLKRKINRPIRDTKRYTEAVD